MWELGSFRTMGDWVRFARLGCGPGGNWVCFAFLVPHKSAVGGIGFVSRFWVWGASSAERLPMNRDKLRLNIGVAGLRPAILFWWAWFVTPPVFGVALSLIMRRIIP